MPYCLDIDENVLDGNLNQIKSYNAILQLETFFFFINYLYFIKQKILVINLYSISAIYRLQRMLSLLN